MQAIGDFIFKSLERKEGGSFENDKGQTINYNSSYSLKVDEIIEGSDVNERKLKVDEKNKVLIEKLKSKKLYEPIKLKCDVQFYGSVAKVIPVDLIDSNNK